MNTIQGIPGAPIEPCEMDDYETEDINDFIESAAKYQEGNKVQPLKSPTSDESPEMRKRGLTPGQPSQYALYGSGYAPTTETVSKLPSGCYDVVADNKTVYVVPSIKPSGILLELPEMRSEEVIKMVENFWNSETDYKEGNDFVVGGASFKAGIMLYGPPGSGKSCTLKLVCNKLIDRGGTVFYASGHPANILTFLQDFARIEDNRKSIVIFEDIDSLIYNWGEAMYLEMLDSAKSIDNVLFIATTNYPEKLDPRIYNRPGRFSHVIKIGLPSAKTREAYLRAILKNHKDVPEIVEKTAGFTIDHLTSLVNAVYREKKNLQNEITRLKLLFNVPKSDERTISIGIGKDSEVT